MKVESLWFFDFFRNFALLLIEEYIAEVNDNLQEILNKLNEKGNWLTDKEYIRIFLSYFDLIGITVMKQKDITLSQEDAIQFSQGTSLQTQNVTPMIGTCCKTLLLRYNYMLIS